MLLISLLSDLSIHSHSVIIHFHSFIHSFIHTFIHSFIHSFIHQFIHSYIQSFIHSFIQLFSHSFIYSFIRSFVHSFISLWLVHKYNETNIIMIYKLSTKLFFSSIGQDKSKLQKQISKLLITEYFSFQPVLHDWCNKGCGMCYPVCRMVHLKDPCC